jgi:hypothetical protein
VAPLVPGGEYRARLRRMGKPLERTDYDGSLGPGRMEVPRGTLRFLGVAAHGLDLSAQVIDNYLARDSRFRGCDFSRVSIEGGVLGDIPFVTYSDCIFDESDLRRVGPLYARFERCRFVGARLDSWHAMCAEFVDCVFTGRIVGAFFSGRPVGVAARRVEPLRAVNAFDGNDFSRAELIDCTIAGGIALKANVWPTGPDYLIVHDAQKRFADVRKRIDDLPLPLRIEALARLEAYQSAGFELQDDILVRREELGAAGVLLDE